MYNTVHYNVQYCTILDNAEQIRGQIQKPSFYINLLEVDRMFQLSPLPRTVIGYSQHN